MSTFNEQCALCQATKKLRRSHIIPKFVFEWIKQRGHQIRRGDQPNLALQDGPKLPLFCHGCEQIFSGWERQSAPIFRQVNTSELVNFTYGPSFLPFCVSLSYRVLLYHQGWVCSTGDQAESVTRQRDQAISSWRGYLLGEDARLGPFEHHCFVLPHVDPTSLEMLTLKSFIDGIVDFQPPIVAPDKSIIVVTKLCRLCIIGTVKRGHSTDWIDTRIAAKGGTFASPFAAPSWFGDYLRSRFTESTSMTDRLSQRQRELMWNQAVKNGWIDAMTDPTCLRIGST